MYFGFEYESYIMRFLEKDHKMEAADSSSVVFLSCPL